MLTLYLLNLFSISLVICSFMVIFSNHAVYSLLYLVACFLISSCILFLLECELLALLFIIIYVGAIAVLFLFSIMMVETKISELSLNATRYFPTGLFFGFGLLLLLFIEVNVTFPVLNGKSTKTPINSYYAYDHVLAWVSYRVAPNWRTHCCVRYPNKNEIPMANVLVFSDLFKELSSDRALLRFPMFKKNNKDYRQVRYNNEYPLDTFRQQLTYIAFQIAKPISNYEYFLVHPEKLICQKWWVAADCSTNVKVYGTTLYTEYVLPLLLLGLILLMVLIGVVYLTNSYRFDNQLQEQLKFKQIA